MNKTQALYQWGQLAAPLIATAAVSFASQAHAATLGSAADYNVFTLGNVTQQWTDIEGKVAAGGNISFSGGIGHKLPANSGNVAVAGGNFTYNGGELQHGNAVYGGQANLFNGANIKDGNLVKGNPIDFNAAGQYLKTLSSSLGNLAANGTVTNQYGQLQLTGNDSKLNIFTLSGATLAVINNFQIFAPPGSTVVVNVTGTIASMQNFGFNINGTDQQKVLYNFAQATQLTLSSIGVQGSILAPLAAVTFNNGQLNGNLIAGSLSGSGESHNYLFNGTLPDAPTGGQNTAPVPEPTTMAGTGLFALLAGWYRRRREKTV